MKYLLLTPAITLISFISLFAQTENTAAVVWERYRVADQRVSFVLPKLPTVLRGHDPCTEVEIVTQRAYAEGAAYEVTVFSKKEAADRPQWCNNPRNRFDEKALDKRLDQIEEERKFKGRTTAAVGGREAVRFTAANATRVVVPDIEANKRWIELEVMHYPDATPDLDRFFGSLKFESSEGKNPGDGSEVTLGDAGVQGMQPEITLPAKTPAEVPAGSGQGNGPGPGTATTDPNRTVVPFTLVTRERARYTDAARQANVQGTVRLKVTLLANGAVGSVMPVTRLPFGLTEQSIYAAKRLVFLPKKVNGQPASVIVTIDYSFSIY